MLHWNGLIGFSLKWITFTCRTKLHLRLKEMPHSAHFMSFSLWWTPFMWSSKCIFRGKSLEQWMQEKIFVGKCTLFVCICSETLSLKTLMQNEHCSPIIESDLIIWVLLWDVKWDFAVNDNPHSSQVWSLIFKCTCFMCICRFTFSEVA